MSHFSNGDLSTPNHGLNMQAWKLGLGYSFGENCDLKYTPYVKPEYHRFFGQLSAGTGVKSSKDKHYTFVNLFLNGGVSFHPFHRLVTGITFFNEKPSSEIESQIGFSVGYQIIIGRIATSIQSGWYMKEYHEEPRYYQIALQYRWRPHVLVIANLRASQKLYSEDLSFGF